MTGRKGRKDYPKWVKKESVRLYLEEGRRSREFMALYSIRDRKRISAWVRQYRAEGQAMFEEERHGDPSEPIQPSMLPGWKWSWTC